MIDKLTLAFIESAARTIHVTAWAEYVEEHCKVCDRSEVEHNQLLPHAFAPKESLAGVNLLDIAPPVSDLARIAGAMLAGHLCEANGVSIPVLLHRARVADEIDGDADASYAREFGHAVAMEALGTGVSWLDDHGEFELVVPEIRYHYEAEDEFVPVREMAVVN